MPKPKRTSASKAKATAKDKAAATVTPITQNPRPEVPLPPPVVSDVSDVSDASDCALASDRSAEPLAFGPTPLAVAFRYVEPTWRNYIQYVDLEARSGNKDAMRYLAVWQSLPLSERRSASPEQLCQLCDVQPSDLVSWVSRQVWQEGSAEASMVMSFQRHKVIAKTAQFAMDSPDNYKHAELFMKASGMMPQTGRGGSTPVTIFNAPTATANATALSKSGSATGSVSGLADMDDEIVSMSKVMQSNYNDAQLHRKDLSEGPEDGLADEREDEPDADEEDDSNDDDDNDDESSD